MIGTDYFGLHPKKEVDKAGDNLSIMKDDLGLCLVRTHPELKEETTFNKDLPRRLNAWYSANALELLQSCTKCTHFFVCHVPMA